MSQPTLTFPNVVGCDLYRAKAMILSKLPYNRIRFRVINSAPGKRNPEAMSYDNEIVLMYNPKDNSIWTTPKFYGVINTEKDVVRDENEWHGSGSEGDNSDWSDN